MDMICKAIHTEDEEFYCIAKDDNNIYYVLTDDEYSQKNLKLPYVVLDLYQEDCDKVKGKYKHFKGNEYDLISLSYDTKGNKYVFYRALYESDIKYFIRPYDMFFEKVDKEKYTNVKQENRFMKID